MSMKIDWDEIGKDSNKKFNNGEKKQVEFLRLSAGNTYNVRPLGSPVVFHKYFLEHEGTWRWAICGDLDTCPIRKNHNIEPRERYAINVIDRADGKVKVMEGPVTVFKVFRVHFEASGNSPGGAEGGDFKISITGAGKKTRYETVFTGRAPFTQQEREHLKANGLFDLEKIYAATPVEEIENVLFGEAKNKKDATNSGSDAPKETVAILSQDEPPAASDDVPW